MTESSVSTKENRDLACAPVLRELQAGIAWISDGPLGATILDLLLDATRRHPEAVAIADAHVSMTYAQLWNFADAFRRRLISQGIRPADPVGIAAGRSLPTVAAILGVVMAGGCYVPIDLEEFPASLPGPLVEQSGLRHWIADMDARPTVLSQWKGNESSILSLEDVFCPPGRELASIPTVGIDADSPLYVMFTSGSTGVPKGVVVPHRAVARLVTAQNFMQFGPQQTFLLHSPLSFDASTLELWGSLLHGGRLAIAPKGRLGLDSYAQLLREQGVTTLWLTAAMFHLAAEHAPEMFAPLNQLLFGGDVISPQHVQSLRELYPALHMVNGYGPTENTTFTCCYVVPEAYRAEGTLPIGSPIAHTTVYILDDQLQPVGNGQAGELVTGGAGVALGYLAQPEATAERFLPDPFSSQPGAQLYRTGDRARCREDGAIEFLGRLDRQIKLAGHRVELAAVESAISSSPLVADAAVVVLTPRAGEKQIAACVSLLRTMEDAEGQLRRWLHERLARIAIPRHWLFLNRLPINANGKLDRGALQAMCEKAFLVPPRPTGNGWPRSAAPARTTDIQADTVEIARTMDHVRQLWARLLGRDAIGNDENFFDLGGTSLLLIEMHARLRAQFTEVPSLVEMFAFPTPRTLAARLRDGQKVSREPEAAEQRGQRQRAAMLARHLGPSASRAATPNATGSASARKDGTR